MGKRGYDFIVRLAAVFGLLFVAMSAAPRWVLMDLQRLPIPQTFLMVEDDLDNKYFGTSMGLTLVDKSDNYQIFTKAQTKGGLISDSIVCMALDQYRALWVGTPSGLSVYDNSQWKHYTRDSTKGGLPDDGILALTIHGEDKWVGTRNGFALFHGNSWTTYTGDKISGRLPNKTVTAIAVDSSDNTWIGTIGGLVRFAGSSWTQFNMVNTRGGLPHNSITYLMTDSRGDLWIGTQSGVARLDHDGKWTNFQNDSDLGELAHELTYSISRGPSGEVWVCLRGGSARYMNGKWEKFTSSNTLGLMTRFIYYVLPGNENEVWFATEKGVITMLPPVRDEDN